MISPARHESCSRCISAISNAREFAEQESRPLNKQKGEAKVGTVVTLAGMSGLSTTTSFFTETLPMLQWFSVLIAILSGIVALALGVFKLLEYIKKK